MDPAIAVGIVQNGDAFEQLIKTGSSAMWIAPLYEDMELRVRKIPNMDIIRWEVNKYEN